MTRSERALYACVSLLVVLTLVVVWIGVVRGAQANLRDVQRDPVVRCAFDENCSPCEMTGSKYCVQK